MTRRRKWFVAACVVAGLLAAAVVVGRLMLSSIVRRRLVQAIEERYGVDVTAGDLSMSVLGGTASLHGLRLSEDGATLVEVERVDLKAGVRDLLDGRIDLAKLLLVRPVIHAVVEANGRTNVHRVLTRENPRAGPPDEAGSGGIIVLRDATIEDGRFEYDDAVADPDRPFRIVFSKLNVKTQELQLAGKPATPCWADVRLDCEIEQRVFPARMSVVAWSRPFGNGRPTFTLHGAITGLDLTGLPQYVTATQRAAVGGDLLHLVADIEVRDGVIGPGAVVGEIDGAGTVLPMVVGGTTDKMVFDVDSRLGSLLSIPLGRVGHFGEVALGAGWSALRGGADAAADVGKGVYGAGEAVGGGIREAAGDFAAGDPLGVLRAAGGGAVGGVASLGSGLVEGVKSILGIGASAVSSLSPADAAELDDEFRGLHARRRAAMVRAALASVPDGPAGGRRKRVEEEVAAAPR